MVSCKRFNCSFGCDFHGPADVWQLAVVLAHTGKVLLLSNPVVAGYAQNPISVYFCYDAAGKLAKAISEVRRLPVSCASAALCSRVLLLYLSWSSCCLAWQLVLPAGRLHKPFRLQEHASKGVQACLSSAAP